MSILIKDMKMPKRCLDCPLYDYYNYHCQMYAFGIPARYNRDGSIRPEWCELVELPEKHGRLIDADKLKLEYPHDADWEYPVTTNERACETIDEQPTVIEAEGET